MAVADIITAIDAAILVLVNNPEVTYKIGNKTVNSSDKMDQLLEAREKLLAAPDSEIDVAAFDTQDISQFGEDLQQYIS